MQNSQMKVFVVGPASGYANWISDKLTKSLEEADLVLLTGGEDVNPKYYKEVPHRTTHFTDRDVHEFKVIEEAIKLKKPLYGTCRGLQILTVAAGGSLIQHQSNNYSTHIVNDILTTEFSPKLKTLGDFNRTKFTNEIYRDLISDYFGVRAASLSLALKRKFLYYLMDLEVPMITSSAHHQAAYPYTNLKKEEYKILTWTTGMHLMHLNGKNEELEIPEEVEIESMYLSKINAFGVQGHPEWMLDDFNNVVNRLSEKFEAVLTSLKNTNQENYLFIISNSLQKIIEITSSNDNIEALSMFRMYQFYLSCLDSIVLNSLLIGSRQLQDILLKYYNFMLGCFRFNNVLSAIKQNGTGLNDDVVKTAIKNVITRNYLQNYDHVFVGKEYLREKGLYLTSLDNQTTDIKKNQVITSSGGVFYFSSAQEAFNSITQTNTVNHPVPVVENQLQPVNLQEQPDINPIEADLLGVDLGFEEEDMEDDW